MLPLLLSTAALAGDIDIGATRRLGIGFGAGLPSSVTVKWLADRRNGVAIHVGPMVTTSGLHTRVQFEQWARRLRAWDIAELGIGWQAGVLVNLVFGQASEQRAARLGITLGATVELRLSPVPVSLYGEVSPVLYPLDLLPGSNFLPAGVTVAVGARWYVGGKKVRELEAIEALPAVDDVLSPSLQPAEPPAKPVAITPAAPAPAPDDPPPVDLPP